jgi:mannose-6-phosphate isomerase-like protein (cupin superfamily)
MSGVFHSRDMVFVPKTWGWEQWIVNNEKYCGKLLFIKAHQKCSFHLHLLKDEVLFIQKGRIRFSYRYIEEAFTEWPLKVVLDDNYAYHVQPGLVHQMEALEDTLIIEFSTQHFDSDSYRVNSPEDWNKFQEMYFLHNNLLGKGGMALRADLYRGEVKVAECVLNEHSWITFPDDAVGVTEVRVMRGDVELWKDPVFQVRGGDNYQVTRPYVADASPSSSAC